MTDPETVPQTSTARRLARLVRLARAADLWERVWRGLIPPFVVIGLFLCLSWLGLWLEIPRWGRAAGVALFGILLLLSTFGLWRLGLLSRQDALRRIDRATGLSHRPASVLDDHLATPGRDAMTDALWTLHQRRAAVEAERLKVAPPSPRVVDLDRYALRAGIVVALIACAIVAGPQLYARVAAAFDFGAAGSIPATSRLDAWIDPPAYTGKAPILLDLASAAASDEAHPAVIAAPAGSMIVIRTSGGPPVDVETSGPLLPPAKSAPRDGADGTKTAAPAPDQNETRLVLHGDGRLTLRQDGRLRGVFDLTAIADRPPSIMLRELPKMNARGSMVLAYETSDDYGVAKAFVEFSDPKIDGESLPGPSLVEAPRAVLALPGATNGLGDAETTIDLSDHPWAGAEVTMQLVARDDAGNEGRSEPFHVTLPQKPFINPLARALVEQRRLLVLDPGHKAAIGAALEALAAHPDMFGTSAGAYLGLRFASDSLAHARSDQDLRDVAEFLWGMAQQIENGDLSEAERALRAAEKELRDAIDRRAPESEIQRLTQNLQAAMDKFLKELAEQQRKEDGQQSAQDNGRPAKTISQKDLQKLIDQLKEQMRSGNREEAKKALDELQDLLENLKAAKRQQADPQMRAMTEGLNQLDQAMRDQQDLRDDTYRQGQQGGQSEQNQANRQGNGADDGMSGSQSQGGQSQNGRRGRGQPKAGDLSARQSELRQRLAQIQKKLRQAGEGQKALDDAAKEMAEAENALRQGEGSNGQAVDSQGRALDAMRRGAKKLADAMQQQGDPNGQGKSDSEAGQSSPNGEQSGSADPLGRPRGDHSIDSAVRFNPLGLPAAQRAQAVLEELRRRLSDPSRSQEEIEYLERLLHSY